MAVAVHGERPFAEALHGPRNGFHWCACPACAAAPPRMLFGGVASAIPNPHGVCIHCFYDWWSVHQSDATGTPPVEWARPPRVGQNKGEQFDSEKISDPV